ncbi:MAG: hypothetical protein JWP75_3443 [Frondihabitans sp.]|nr:hypothetical protein [Frondihabitans sp.]
MTTTMPTTHCPSCGVPHLGTRFCENCGTELMRGAPVIAVTGSQPLVTVPKPALPLVLLLAGIIGPAVVGAVSSWISFTLVSAAYSVPFEIVIFLFLALVPVAVFLVGRAGRATSGARIGGLLLAVLGPAIELMVILMMDGRVAVSPAAVSAVEQSLYLVGPVVIVLAWLMTTGSPPSSYRVLWIAAAVAVVYILVAYLVPVNTNAAIIWRSLAANLVRAGGILAVILLIPRFVRIRTATGVSRPFDAAVYGGGDAAYRALQRPNSTNGFAVSALIFGLLGGTIFPIVFGHVALAQIERTGERGRGMAIAGLILGYLSVAVVLVILIVIVVAAANAARYY